MFSKKLVGYENCTVHKLLFPKKLTSVSFDHKDVKKTFTDESEY